MEEATDDAEVEVNIDHFLVAENARMDRFSILWEILNTGDSAISAWWDDSYRVLDLQDADCDQLIEFGYSWRNLSTFVHNLGQFSIGPWVLSSSTLPSHWKPYCRVDGVFLHTKRSEQEFHENDHCYYDEAKRVMTRLYKLMAACESAANVCIFPSSKFLPMLSELDAPFNTVTATGCTDVEVGTSEWLTRSCSVLQLEGCTFQDRGQALCDALAKDTSRVESLSVYAIVQGLPADSTCSNVIGSLLATALAHSPKLKKLHVCGHGEMLSDANWGEIVEAICANKKIREVHFEGIHRSMEWLGRTLQMLDTEHLRAIEIDRKKKKAQTMPHQIKTSWTNAILEALRRNKNVQNFEVRLPGHVDFTTLDEATPSIIKQHKIHFRARYANDPGTAGIAGMIIGVDAKQGRTDRVFDMICEVSDFLIHRDNLKRQRAAEIRYNIRQNKMRKRKVRGKKKGRKPNYRCHSRRRARHG